MILAVGEAEQAGRRGEVPVGALAVDLAGNILGRAGNSPISLADPSAHAEILALRQAAGRKKNYRLTDVLLVATLEPCLMCLGAIIQARLAGLVFGAHDPKSGVVSSRLELSGLNFLNHRLPVISGILSEQCSALLSGFFKPRR